MGFNLSREDVYLVSIVGNQSIGDGFAHLSGTSSHSDETHDEVVEAGRGIPDTLQWC